MAKRKKSAIYVPKDNNVITCPLDLDSLIMSQNCTPKSIEENLNVSDDIIYDAIRMCVNSNWLLKMDVMSEFSKETRLKLFRSMSAFPRLNSAYFLIQSKMSNPPLYDEAMGIVNPSDFAGINLLNPYNRLGNDNTEEDMDVMRGRMSLKEFIDNRISRFLKSKDKNDIDFSQSIFLPEILTPKFFSSVDEYIHLIILSNLDRYFTVLKLFQSGGMSVLSAPKRRINPILALIKHILASDGNIFTMRTRTLAWKQFFKRYEDVASKRGIGDVAADSFFDMDIVQKHFDELKDNVLDKKEIHMMDVESWLSNADGLFESFELDCTLHNLNASDFIFIILVTKYHKMADGLVNFQDNDERNIVFKTIASAIRL